jgi:hypothetical protein
LDSFDGVPVVVDVSWMAARPATHISVQAHCEGGLAEWRNVDGSIYRFRTEVNSAVRLERETTLRSDTLATLIELLEAGSTSPPNLLIYDLLQQAYSQAQPRPGADGYSPEPTTPLPDLNLPQFSVESAERD